MPIKVPRGAATSPLRKRAQHRRLQISIRVYIYIIYLLYIYIYIFIYFDVYVLAQPSLASRVTANVVFLV